MATLKVVTLVVFIVVNKILRNPLCAFRIQLVSPNKALKSISLISLFVHTIMNT